MMITGILSDNHARTLLTSHARYSHRMPTATVRPMLKGKVPKLLKRLAVNDTNLPLGAPPGGPGTPRRARALRERGIRRLPRDPPRHADHALPSGASATPEDD